MPHDISELIESNIEMGHEKYMFNVLGGNVENFESLGSLCGCDAALDPYYIHLEDKPRKIVWHTIFDFSFDFSIAFDFLKGALIYFVFILCMLSYLQACEPHVVVFNKLKQALTMSSLSSRVLKT